MEVVIRFTPHQARWIRERKWHSTARVEGLLDGGCLLRLRVGGLGEVQRWVMQFGAEAEVLKPAGLRKRVRAELHRACRVPVAVRHWWSATVARSERALRIARRM